MLCWFKEHKNKSGNKPRQKYQKTNSMVLKKKWFSNNQNLETYIFIVDGGGFDMIKKLTQN